MSIFRPAPHKELIQDPLILKKEYRYWRFRIFYSMYFGYALYYFTRKSFTFAMPSLISDLGYDKAQLGILGSVLSISYGASKLVSGIMSDRANPRYFMGLGLLITGVLNIFFGFSSSLLFFALFWGLNGWFQGWGWPPCARLLNHWYSPSERARWWGVWNTSHNLGGALIPLICAWVIYLVGWRGAMMVPGVLCIIAGLFLINRLRDTPQSLGLPPIEAYRNDYPSRKEGLSEEELSVKDRLFKYVLNSKWIWLLAISYFFVYIVRTAVNDWGALFIYEAKGLSMLQATTCVSWFEIGGFCGSLAAGWLSDKLFSSRRGPINILFSFGTVLAIVLIAAIPKGAHLLFFSLAMFLIGFCIFGPQMMIGIAASELSHKKAAGTATGFTGFVAYVGAAMAGYPLGLILEHFGWTGFISTIAVCSGVAVLLLGPFWSIKTLQKEEKIVDEVRSS